MPRIGCTRFRFVPVLPLALVVAALGCQEDAQSPTAPELGPALAIRPANGLSFRQVSAASIHTCGVTPDHRAYCWGENSFGRLGDGTTDIDHLTPTRVVGGLRFRQVSAGVAHTCGVTPDHRAYCWGENSFGQLGDGTTALVRVTPVRVAGGLRFRQVSKGFFHTCGVTPGERGHCWGDNRFGQLGDGTTTDRRTPVAVAGGLRFRQLSGGEAHTCGVTPDNRAYCWGDNRFGQLGDGTTTQRLTPVAVAGGLRFRQVSAGRFHTCGVTPGERAYCWGNNDQGQLGDGTTTRRETPAAVSGGLRFRQLSAGSGGFSHTCGVTPGNLAYCWGSNEAGQLGDGTTTDRGTPVPVAGGDINPDDVREPNGDNSQVGVDEADGDTEQE